MYSPRLIKIENSDNAPILCRLSLRIRHNGRGNLVFRTTLNKSINEIYWLEKIKKWLLLVEELLEVKKNK
jgi:hypothetical protein